MLKVHVVDVSKQNIDAKKFLVSVDLNKQNLKTTIK